MMRSLLARAAGAVSSSGTGARSPSALLAPAAAGLASHYSSKAKGTAVPAKKPGATGGGKYKDRKAPTYAKVDDMAASAPSADDVEFELPKDPLPVPPFDPTLDVRPDGRPLFCRKASLSELTHKDACTYLDFRCIVSTAMGIVSYRSMAVKGEF